MLNGHESTPGSRAGSPHSIRHGTWTCSAFGQAVMALHGDKRAGESDGALEVRRLRSGLRSLAVGLFGPPAALQVVGSDVLEDGLERLWLVRDPVVLVGTEMPVVGSGA